MWFQLEVSCSSEMRLGRRAEPLPLLMIYLLVYGDSSILVHPVCALYRVHVLDLLGVHIAKVPAFLVRAEIAGASPASTV